MRIISRQAVCYAPAVGLSCGAQARLCAAKPHDSIRGYPAKQRQKKRVLKKLKRCYSLKRNKEFRYVYRKGKSKATDLMVLIYTRSRHDSVLVGFSVSKKLGNSVVRNRVKRRLRESFGPMIPDVKNGYSLIFIAREPVVNATFPAIQNAMRSTLRRAELLKKEELRQ